ncbi:hypothetical protein B0H67DRAFT_274649 [Lasiosphaeris hirsuta]|uniref:Uncharacterized protein n=1 Tax=Lasiosphaeris hirsuta TaxID=260670 RepID=A0AA40A8L6_9PEZI|nr:hypothetical protein B0H67DRAFT_274649 [Lasiosphaeris hirsuta]
MSSSTTGALTRSRSVRKPSAKSEKDEAAPRTVSPSRLPVKGIANSASNGIDRPSAKTASTVGTRGSRPLSGVFGRTKQATGVGQDTASSAIASSRPPRTTRPPTTRPASLSGPPSSTSSSRPTTSSGVPASSASTTPRVPSGHARTKSSVTTLTGATILRPPSGGSVASTSSGTTQADRSRPPLSSTTRSAAHRRQPSGPTPSASSSSSATTTSRKPSREQPQPQTQPQQQPPPGSAAARLRPAFSTLQQHYSPAKSLAPKPLTATYLAPPSPSKLPANVAISAETARLQTELLQLHLLHRDADSVTQQWRESARQKLGARFGEVVRRGEEVGGDEASVVERGNVGALIAWGSGRSLEERVQVLDAVLCGLWSLGEPGGRFARVVRRFEKWAERVEEVAVVRRKGTWGVLEMQMQAQALQQQQGKGGDGNDLFVLVGQLDPQWKEECAGLVRRLDEWRRRVVELAGGEQETEEKESSLARILAACRALIHDMLAELDIMERIEREAVAEENRWVREVNRGMDGEGGEDGDNPRAGAIWRAL